MKTAYEKQKSNMEKVLTSSTSDADRKRNAGKELDKMKAALLKIETLQESCINDQNG
jgi:hypothetical protein